MWKLIKYSIKNTWNYKGRASRSEYWLFQLFTFLITLLTVFLILLVIVSEGEPNLKNPTHIPIGYLIFLSIPGIFIFLPGFSLVIRRFHDVGLSAWWLILIIIPMIINPIIGETISSLAIFIISLTPGQKKTNKYGKQP